MKRMIFLCMAVITFTSTFYTAKAQTRMMAMVDMNFAYQMSLPLAATFPLDNKLNKFKNSIQSLSKRMMPSVAMATEFCSSLQFKYAQILNRDVELLTNTSLIGFIDEWWGTKYRYGGTTKKGIDCSSFTGQLMSSVFGLTLPRTAREQFAKCTRLLKDEMLEGDLVFFNTRGGVSHVGVYLGEGYFVHSSCTNGVSISSLKEPYYAKKFIAGGRVEVAAETPTENCDSLL